jgi:hypothetical protein
MGCDIHAYIEYEGGPDRPFEALFLGEVELPRNYRVFKTLAGLRSDTPPLFPPRGIPEDVSEAAFEGYYLFVIDPADCDLYRGYNFVTLEEAEQWARSGVKRVPTECKKSGLLSPHGYIPDSTRHTPSWLWLSEIRQALEHSGLREDQLAQPYQVLLETMESVERHMKRKSRLVFWFDN